MTWLDEPLAILDTETTSADPEDARIVSIYIGLVERPGGPLIDVLDTLVNPGIPIPPETTAIHGITDEQVANAITATEAAAKIAEKLAMIYGTPIVGHNLAYDYTVMDRELSRHDTDTDTAMPPFPAILDTLILFRRFDYTTGGRSLEALAKRHGITFPAHNAKEDAFASLRLLHILAQENDLLEHTPVETLQGLQAKWYEAQQEAIYWKRRGNGHNDPPPATDWPIRPRQETTT